MKVAAVVALPLAGALMLSACSGQDSQRIVNLSSGESVVTPTASPTPDAVAMALTPAQIKAVQAANKKDQAQAAAAVAGKAKASTTTKSAGSAGSSGWKEDFFDGFNGSSLNGRMWGAYNGKPHNDSVSTWRSSQVSVSGGLLHLKASNVNGQWLTSGVSAANAGTKKYGKWSIRFRVPKATGVSWVILLYPSEGWPPEWDLIEDDGGGTNRTKAVSVLHYGSSNTQIQKGLTGDFSNWTTLTAISKPGKASIAINGKTQASFSSWSGVPSVPMWLGIQTQVNRCSSSANACVSSSTPKSIDMQVAWVAHWSATK